MYDSSVKDRREGSTAACAGRHMIRTCNSATAVVTTSPDNAAEMLPIVTETFIQCKNVLSLAVEAAAERAGHGKQQAHNSCRCKADCRMWQCMVEACKGVSLCWHRN